MGSFGANTIGGPLTASLHVQPADAGLRHRQPARGRPPQQVGRGDVRDNVTDERAFLALDQERGTRARIGYLTNQPRTFGIATRMNF